MYVCMCDMETGVKLSEGQRKLIGEEEKKEGLGT